MTATGVMALSKLSTFSRLPSVSPWYLERKFLRMTIGTPMSLAKQVMRKVLPVPTGPATRVTHGHHVLATALDGCGGLHQVGLGLLVTRDIRQRKLALHKFQQSACLGLDELLFLAVEVTVGEFELVFDQFAQEHPQVCDVEAGGIFWRARRCPFPRAHVGCWLCCVALPC